MIYLHVLASIPIKLLKYAVVTFNKIYWWTHSVEWAVTLPDGPILLNELLRLPCAWNRCDVAQDVDTTERNVNKLRPAASVVFICDDDDLENSSSDGLLVKLFDSTRQSIIDELNRTPQLFVLSWFNVNDSEFAFTR
jgi:hypothetical protein